VAARIGVAVTHILTIVNAFNIENASRADLDRIRHNPDVLQLEQDIVIEVD